MPNNTDMRSEGMNPYILSNHTIYTKAYFLALKNSDIRFNNDKNLNAIQIYRTEVFFWNLTKNCSIRSV